MSKKGTLGYQAELLRSKGQRRIKRLEAVLYSENTPQRVRDWASQQVREIKSAMQGTRQYSASGKRYKTKNENYIKGQMDRLSAAVEKVAPRYTVSGDSFEVTQRELNRASVNLPSVYTRQEVAIFYRSTQRIWQQEGVGEHERNEAILDYYNQRRRENGLSPLSLEEVVDYVVDANRRVQKLQEVETNKPLDDEESEALNEAQQYDTADGERGSHSNVGQAVINAIRDAMQDLFVLPDPNLAS